MSFRQSFLTVAEVLSDFSQTAGSFILQGKLA
jgi:hypothetical protein